MKITTRLNAYALSSAAFLCTAVSATGQVIYTDLSPDHLIEDNAWAPAIYTDAVYDVDGDGQDDISFIAKYSYWGGYYTGSSTMQLQLLPVASGAGIFGTTNAAPICTGELIGSGAYFNPTKNQIAYRFWDWSDYWTSSTCLATGSSSRATGGAFGTPAYLGFKFEISGNTHFGWVRFTINNHRSLTLDGFAYQATPGVPILAGQEPNNLLTTALDVANTGTAADIEFSFASLNDESLVSEYRVMVVPKSIVGSFDLAAAQSAVHYDIVSPSGLAIYTNTLSPGSKDVLGNDILSDTLHVAVLAVGTTGGDLLGEESDFIKLSLLVEAPLIEVFTPISPAIKVGTLADLLLSFTTEDHLDISEYRVFLTEYPGNLDAAAAEALPADRYLSVPVPASPGTIDLNFLGLSKDAAGNPIEHGKFYRGQVLAVAMAGGTAAESNISISFWAPQLSFNARKVEELMLSDTDEYGTSADFRVEFEGYENATSISEYRAFIIPDVDSFDLADALTKPASQYLSFPITGTGILGAIKSYSENLPPSMLDYNGDSILHGIAYDAVVVTMGTGLVGDDFERSAFARVLNVVLDPADSVSTVNSYANGDPSDIDVSFEKSDDEEHISAYRIVYAPADSIVDLSVILAAGVDRSTDVPPTGAVGPYVYNVALPAGMKDIYGVPHVNNTSYKAIVVAIHNGGFPESSAVSYEDGDFEIVDVLDPMDAVVVSDGGDAGNGQDVSISFTVPDETEIDEYRLFAVRQDLPEVVDLDVLAARDITVFVHSFGPTGVAAGSNYSLNLGDVSRSLDGEFIGNGIPYKFYLLSGGNSFSLSLPTEEFMLYDADMAAIPDRVETEATLQQYFYFFEAPKFDQVSSYRIYLLKADDTLGMYPSQVRGLNASITINPNEIADGLWKANLQAASRDVNGNSLVIGQAYEVLVLTEAKYGPPSSNGFTLLETGVFFDFRSGATGLSPVVDRELHLSYFDGKLQFELPDGIQAASMEIYNTAGQLVFQALLESPSIINLPDLPTGVYIAGVRSEDKFYSGKFIKP